MLQAYERALALTHSMLEAARRGDWDELVRIEGERARLVEQIRTEDAEPARDPRQAGRRPSSMMEIALEMRAPRVLTSPAASAALAPRRARTAPS